VTRAVRLRGWQRRALARLESHREVDFLAVATPGAGKTTFALTAVRRHLAEHPDRRLVVVAPTAHLKSQWADAAARFDLLLDDTWSPAQGRLPQDVHGIVTTYQQVATAARALEPIARDGLVVFDEIHHAGEERAWGTGIKDAFQGAAWRLALSGTPFRSDTRAIPFVTYALDEAMPNFEYGYDDALADGHVVRRVEFPSLNGEMEWVSPDGSRRVASFDDPLEATLAAQRLRTALSAEGEWLPAVLDAAQARLTEVRRRSPDAGGLVIAGDQEHARDIAALLRGRHGVDAVVATSDDPEASCRIARFRDARDPWIVAVRMVSEGVDLPRLRVGVFATTTTTELFFRQAVGRLVRWRSEDDDARAWMFIPDDPRLRARAQQIADQRRHSLRAANARSAESREPDGADDGADEQLSMFAALSAVPVGTFSTAASPVSTVPLRDGLLADADPDDDLVFELPPLPSRSAADDEGPSLLDPRASRRHLRTLNTARAADLVRYANLTHAQVNAELNRLAGVDRVTEATEEQLRRRLDAAERWLRR
jgi:superfamily II DNA or RNA helicase